MRQRFDRQVTAIVAAPGFGKTTLLAQAVAENSLAPLGQDYWLTCQRDDVSLSFLAESIFDAVGIASPVPDDPVAAAVAVADAIWSAAPTHLAIVFDDAHLIASGTPGARFLSGLVRELPGNGHVVLASRPPVPLPMSRMRVTGEALVLDEADMQFVDDEVEAFARTRGVARSTLKDAGGWPALAELTATVGPHAAEGFVWEELLSQLSVERRDALSLLSAVGGADQEIASAMFGTQTDLDDLLSGLPLVVRTKGEWRSLHGLWSSALQHRVAPSRVAEARTVAGRILRRRRHYRDAMALFIEAEAWTDVRGLIVDVCEVCTPLASQDVLEVWARDLPVDIRDTPEGLLLQAMVSAPTSPASASRLLHQALDHAGAEREVSFACLNALVQLAFWRSDRAQMQDLAQRLGALGSTGHQQGPSWTSLIDAVLAPTVELTRAALKPLRLRPSEALNPVQDWLHAHIVLLKLGDPDAADGLARRALGHDMVTMAAVSRSSLVESLRMRGRLDDVRAMRAEVIADLNPVKVLTSPELVTNAVVLLSVLGRHEQAAELLDLFRPVLARSPVGWAAIAVPVADAFHLVSIGEEARAAEQLSVLADHPVARRQSSVQVSASALTMLYVLLPSVRAAWDAVAPPGYFAELLSVVRALTQIREDTSVELVRLLPPAARAIVLPSLPPPWAAVLATAMIAVGQDEGLAMLEQLGPPARATLRRCAGDETSPIAATARAVLRDLPATPPFVLELRVLGAIELRRDGQPMTPPQLRRERVRQLLAYLLTHRRPARTSIMADLWPDLDDTAAARNLRVTLTYLHGALEPDRPELDPPYFVRADGGVLRLHAEEGLEVDAMVFEQRLDEAEQLDRQGALSTALTGYEAALRLWRGPYFDGLVGADWLQWERNRLERRFVATAIRAGNLLLARGDVLPAGQLGDRALATDPWSEEAYQLLMAVALSRSDRDGARRYFRACHAMLRDLGAAPAQRTVGLGRKLAAGG